MKYFAGIDWGFLYRNKTYMNIFQTHVMDEILRQENKMEYKKKLQFLAT